MTAPAARRRISLALALGLHLGLLSALPEVRRLFQDGTPAPPPVQAAALAEVLEVIPIRLPASPGWQLQTELGAIRRSTGNSRALPPARVGAAQARMQLSQSLESAAQEAAAAYERLQQAAAAQATRFVADLELADLAVQLPRPPAPAPGAAAASAGSAESAVAPDPAPPRTQAASPPVAAAPPRPAPPRAAAAPAAPRRAPDALPAPRRTEPPPASAAVRPYAGSEAEVIAEAPPLPPPAPAGAPLPPPLTAGNARQSGASPAPDRGAGEAVPNRNVFFQRLTAHLFDTNQQVLAEAVRATPRVTVDVRFSIDRSGRVLGAQVERTTGSAALDDKALRVIHRASPVPSMSPDMPQQRLELSFPVQIYR